MFHYGTFGSSNSAVGVVLLSLWFFDNINPTFLFTRNSLPGFAVPFLLDTVKAV